MLSSPCAPGWAGRIDRMKILVADDDPLIRRLLLALLTKMGHEVEVVEEGLSAMKILESSAPPDLAILDWVMPGLNGPEVCKKLRAREIPSRTYVLLLSAKAEKTDIVAGLDAGADDYLVKPFDPMALLARLRVAQRIIAYHQELQTHIDGMERLLQRHSLLGELFGKQGRIEPGRVRTAAPGPTLAAVSPECINDMLARALAEIGLGNAQAALRAPSEPPSHAMFTAWAPLVLPREEVWVDLLLEADDSAAVAKFESLLGRIPVSERELLDFLAEAFNLLCTAMRGYLLEQGFTALLPIISRSIRTSSLTLRPASAAQTSRHRLTLSAFQLEVTAIRHAAPVVTKTLGELRELDLLAENLASPTANEVILLNQGVVLNSRYIEKLVSMAEGDKRNLRLPVIQPSALAEFFCLGRVSNG
jgi:CheY-like chemotaxis protein